MSSILKALKKAEEARTDHPSATTKAKTFRLENKKSRIIRIMMLPFTLILLFIMIYLSYSKLPLINKTDRNTKGLNNVTQILPANTPQPVAKATADKPHSSSVNQTGISGSMNEASDANKLNDEAIKEIRKKNFAKAESLLNLAISQAPDKAELYNHLGFALKSQSRYKDAILQYEKALSIKPDFPEALNNLALAYELNENKQKAFELYSKAITLKPAYADAHLNIALLMESMGRYKDAESHFHTFITLSNDTELKKKVKEKISTLKR